MHGAALTCPAATDGAAAAATAASSPAKTRCGSAIEPDTRSSCEASNWRRLRLGKDSCCGVAPSLRPAGAVACPQGLDLRNQTPRSMLPGEALAQAPQIAPDHGNGKVACTYEDVHVGRSGRH